MYIVNAEMELTVQFLLIKVVLMVHVYRLINPVLVSPPLPPNILKVGKTYYFTVSLKNRDHRLVICNWEPKSFIALVPMAGCFHSLVEAI